MPLDIPSSAAREQIVPPPLANDSATTPQAANWQRPDTRPPAMADDFSFLQEGIDEGIPAGDSQAAGDLSTLWDDLSLNNTNEDGLLPVDAPSLEASAEDDLDIDLDGLDAPTSPHGVVDPTPNLISPFDLPSGAPPPIVAPPPAPSFADVAPPAAPPPTYTPLDEIEIDLASSTDLAADDDDLDIEIDLEANASGGGVPSSILAASGLSGPESSPPGASIVPLPVPPPVPQDDDDDPAQQAIQAVAGLSSSAMARDLGAMAEQLEAEGQNLRAAKLWRAAALLDPLFTLASAALQRLTSQ